MWFQRITYDARFQKEVEYYAQINELIKDEPFRWADAGRDGIQLLDENSVLLKTVDFPGYRWQYRSHCYRDKQDEDTVFFPSYATIAYEVGVVFVNDPNLNRRIQKIYENANDNGKVVYRNALVDGVFLTGVMGENCYEYDTTSHSR